MVATALGTIPPAAPVPCVALLSPLVAPKGPLVLGSAAVQNRPPNIKTGGGHEKVLREAKYGDLPLPFH